MNEITAPLIEVAARASADRWGAPLPPGYIAKEDARVIVYAVLEWLAKNPTGVCPEIGNVIVCDELRVAAKDLEAEGFRPQHAEHPYRVSWRSLLDRAKWERMARKGTRGREEDRH